MPEPSVQKCYNKTTKHNIAMCLPTVTSHYNMKLRQHLQ